MKNKIDVEDYEIGNQSNFDILSFYMSLPDKLEKDDDELNFEINLKEYHHSLFYPILKYCVDVLNNETVLQNNKFNIGFYDSDNKIYVCVGRQMYDLFFGKKSGTINDYTIDFNCGKDNFNLKSIKKEKNIIEEFKIYFDIPLDPQKKITKEIINNKAQELDLTVEQLIENKKKTIVSRFLKGYFHQETILKTLERIIPGKLSQMPNLIFERKNDEGKTIEEIAQIFLLNLDNTKEAIIDGFDYFYTVDYNKKQKEEKKFHNGQKLKLEDDNLYFVEIKDSMEGLCKSYEKLKNVQINEIKDSSTSTYKRENLTDIGNIFLTANIFRKLIKNLLQKDKQINILYIIDDDFNIDMFNIFKKCLTRDEAVLESDFYFKLFLIYTQPDLVLENYIKQNDEKNNLIKNLKETIEKYEKEKTEYKESLKHIIEKHEKALAELKDSVKQMKEKNIERKNILQQIDYLLEKQEFESKFCQIDEEIIEFCKKININEFLITVGILDTLNKNHEYKLTNIKSINDILKSKPKNKYYLIDFKTFNYMNFEDVQNEKKCENSVKTYKEQISYCKYFNNAYLLVDFGFMYNISKIITEDITKNYTISIYMFEKYVFMIYFSKDNHLIMPEVQIIKNSCKNPMLQENIKSSLKDVEEFALNYYNLLLIRNFFSSEQESDNKIDRIYIFDSSNIINYILELCSKPTTEEDDIKNCYIEILSVKSEYNIYYDFYINDLVQEKKYKNIIYVRKTEFGEKYSEEKIKSIISYLFDIKNFVINNQLITEYKKLSILDTGIKYGNNTLIKIMENEHIIPILRKPNLEIDTDSVSLLEYSYFLLLPLLISKKEYKPNILILANDFGFLNTYYSKLYPEVFNIFFFMEKKEFIINDMNLKKINYENMKISHFDKVFKKNNPSNKFILILLECFKKNDENDSVMPSYKNLLSKIKKLLEKDGIFAFNLRTNTFENYSSVLSYLKKHFQKIIDVNFRPCSGLVLCFNNNIKLENYYNPVKELLGTINFKEDIQKKLSGE